MKLYLSEEDVLACLTMPKAIELLDIAFRQLAEGTAINHPRRRVILPTGSVLHYMAAGTPEYFGLKAYSANPKTGAHFEVLLYQSSDALPWLPLRRITSARFGPAPQPVLRLSIFHVQDASRGRNCRQRIQARNPTRSHRQCAQTPRSSRLESQAGKARGICEYHAPRNSDSTSGPWKQRASAWKARISL